MIESLSIKKIKLVQIYPHKRGRKRERDIIYGEEGRGREREYDMSFSIVNFRI